MPTPPRVAHLIPLHTLAEQLAPSYATANNREPHEVYDEVMSGLDKGGLRQPLLDAVWTSLVKERPRLDEAALVERLAKAMTNRKGQGPRPMEAISSVREMMNALMAMIDINVGRASDTARAALETEQGQKMLQQSIKATGEWLAHRILAASRPKGQPDG